MSEQEVPVNGVQTPEEWGKKLEEEETVRTDGGAVKRQSGGNQSAPSIDDSPEELEGSGRTRYGVETFLGDIAELEEKGIFEQTWVNPGQLVHYLEQVERSPRTPRPHNILHESEYNAAENLLRAAAAYSDSVDGAYLEQERPEDSDFVVDEIGYVAEKELIPWYRISLD